jgi:hypothetical protein
MPLRGAGAARYTGDMSAAEDGWEAVHTDNDFWDWPRGGMADFRGTPHAYKATWNDEADDYSEVYALAPIDARQKAAVEEEWRIWLRWLAAHNAGTLRPGDDHPALAADRRRYEELRPIVSEALSVDEESAIKAIPEFRAGVGGYLVRWSAC